MLLVSLLVVDSNHLLARRQLSFIGHPKQVLPLLILVTLASLVDGSAQAQIRVETFELIVNNCAQCLLSLVRVGGNVSGVADRAAASAEVTID